MKKLPAIAFAPTRSFVAGARCVMFFARRGERTLRCYITSAALVSCFGALDIEGDGGRECLRAFDENVSSIRGIARRMIDNTLAPVGAVVITPDQASRREA